MTTINNSLLEIIESENINTEFALNEIVLFKLLSKQQKLNLVVEGFEKKYESTFVEFENLVHSTKNQEDFQIEDDLMDWEFAIESLKAIEPQIETIRRKYDF